MSDTLMDFSGCCRDLMCHVLFNLRADVYMFTSSLILENISGLECVRGVFGSNARPNSRIALFGPNARLIVPACISTAFHQYIKDKIICERSETRRKGSVRSMRHESTASLFNVFWRRHFSLSPQL